MRDYMYHPDGIDPGVPVSQMPTEEIVACLADGFEANGEAPIEAIRDRLQLELFIRERGLR